MYIVKRSTTKSSPNVEILRGKDGWDGQGSPKETLGPPGPKGDTEVLGPKGDGVGKVYVVNVC